MENGIPYLLYKDAANAKSNQQNLGVIQCSNLCTEIMEYTSPEEVAVCNLASICLPRFVVEPEGGGGLQQGMGEAPESGAGADIGAAFDHAALFEVTQVVTRNLNKVIYAHTHTHTHTHTTQHRRRHLHTCTPAYSHPHTHPLACTHTHTITTTTTTTTR